MQFELMDIEGCLLIKPEKIKDDRGYFTKFFNSSFYQSIGINFVLKESYSSFSYKGVLRGLHFQTEPYEHSKLVRCSFGKVVDVILDLRKGSPTFKTVQKVELDSNSGNILYLPAGIAHGFFAIEDSVMEYLVSSEHMPSHDSGILWSSVNVNWPNSKPIISSRDANFLRLDDFDSPFKFIKNIKI